MIYLMRVGGDSSQPVWQEALSNNINAHGNSRNISSIDKKKENHEPTINVQIVTPKLKNKSY